MKSLSLLCCVFKSMMEEPYKRYSAVFVNGLLEDILRSFLWWEGFITDSELDTLLQYNEYLYERYKDARK